MTLTSVHLTNYYHKHSGGISTAYNDLMAAGERHKRRVVLIVPGEQNDIENVNPYARVYYIRSRNSPFIDRRYRLIMPWQYMLKPSLIRDVIVEEDPFMVEVADKYALSILGAMIRKDYFQRLGRPMLVHLSCERMDDNLSTFVVGKRFGSLVAEHMIRNYTLPSFDFHIANSAYTAQELIDADAASSSFSKLASRFFRAPRVPLDDRLYINPVGVDNHLFSPERRSANIREAMCRRADIEQSAKILLYAGRISPEKNIDLLVETMDRLAGQEHKYRLLIAGDGPLSAWLAVESRKHRNIVQLGHLDRETLADYIANADAFVHPNPREPFGLGPLEAMASGTPTVVPDRGGVLSYANERNSWLARPDADAFAAAVVDAAADSSVRECRIHNAMVTARLNSKEASTDSLFATYDTMHEYFLRRKELFVNDRRSQKLDSAEVFARHRCSN